MDSWIIFEAPLIFLMLKLTKFDQWKTFQYGSLTSLTLEHFLFSSIRYCRLTFNIPCPKPWINLLFKEILFLLERMVFRNQDLDYRCSHCYWVASRPIQWAEIGIINFIPQGNFLSFSTPYSVPFLPQWEPGPQQHHYILQGTQNRFKLYNTTTSNESTKWILRFPADRQNKEIHVCVLNPCMHISINISIDSYLYLY